MAARVWIAAALIPPLAAGCASSSVTLLPGERGAAVGAVAVLDEKGGGDRAVIDQANTRASVGQRVSQRALRDGRLSAEDRALIDALPEPPTVFTLYFKEDSTDLTDASEHSLTALFEEVKRRGAGVDIEITGHTDTLGGAEDNDALSLARARAVREALVAKGLDAASTRAVGRGERQLLVPTGDGERLPENRRVEVLVR